MSVKHSPWVGAVEPVKDTPCDRDYWLTDMSAKEIGAKYGFHANQSGKKVGPALVTGAKCRSCGGAISVNNRTEAALLLNSLAQKSGWSTGRWEMQACAGCQEKEREEERIRYYSELRVLDGHRADTEQRFARVQQLRSMPYREYLKTDEWGLIRKAALKRAGYACQVCYSNQSLHVHHRTYRNRGSELPSDLTVLCAECHELFHERMKLAELREDAA